MAAIDFQVLGATTQDFLSNLDALHDHLATIYPGMRAPSFRCSQRSTDGATILHYYSEREGLEHIVKGLVKTVAARLHHSNVDVQIYKTKAECIDHVQFLILQKDQQSKHMNNNLSLVADNRCQEPKINPDAFCRIFPFHILFDRSLNVVQLGRSIGRIIPAMRIGCNINDTFDVIRPHMDLTFDSILAHINTVYVLRSKYGHVQTSADDILTAIDNDHELERLRLKGQMIYIEESDCMLLLCSPCLTNLDDLARRGLYLSDLPLHDATRELVLLSEKFEDEYKLTQHLEVLTDQLQKTHRQLDEEKKKTDRLESNRTFIWQYRAVKYINYCS